MWKGRFIHRNDALADVLYAATIHKQDVDGHVDLAAHAGEAGTVAQAFHGKVTDGAFRSGGAAAFERDGRHGRAGGGHGFGGVITAAVAAVVSHHGVAGDGHFLVIQLLLLQAAVIHALDLHADFFLQAIQCVARNGARAAGRVCVFVGVKAHPYTPPCFGFPVGSLHKQDMRSARGGAAGFFSVFVR